MATQIELDKIKNLKDIMHENGTSYYELLGDIKDTLSDVVSALEGTSYGDIYNAASNTKTQIENIQEICYGSLSAAETYLLKKIAQYELAANSTYQKLNDAVDSLMSIWDNIDMTTWQNI